MTDVFSSAILALFREFSVRRFERFGALFRAVFRALSERRFDQCFKRYIRCYLGCRRGVISGAVWRYPCRFGPCVRRHFGATSGAVSALLRTLSVAVLALVSAPSWRWLVRRLGAGSDAILALFRAPSWCGSGLACHQYSIIQSDLAIPDLDIADTLLYRMARNINGAHQPISPCYNGRTMYTVPDRFFLNIESLLPYK